MSVKIGIVGRGFMGSMHLAAYAGIRGAQVVGICDKRKEMLRPDAQAGGNIDLGGGTIDSSRVKWYSRLEEMLGDPEMDVVDITLPTHLHAGTALKAFAAGKHVICEKPLALNSTDAARIIAGAKKARKRLFVAHCIRYWPPYARAHELVRSGKYGKVLSARFVRLSPTPGWSAGGWITHRKFSGDAALDLHIHDSDFVLYTFGAPRAVVSRGAGIGLKKGRFDHIATTYEYADGKLVTAEGSWIYAPGFEFEMQFAVAMEKATLVCKPDLSLTLHPVKGKSRKLRLPQRDGYDLELRDFVSCLRTGRPCKVVTPNSALQAVKLVEAEIRSARTGRRVAVRL